MTDRFNRIMARVNEWADENAGWDCEADVRNNLNFILNHTEFSLMTDDEIFEECCAVWLEAE